MIITRRRQDSEEWRATRLDDLVPSSRDDDRVHWVWREANARDPFGVTFILDLELAFTKGVPELDGLVTRARDDLSVVGREGDGKDVLGVTNEATSGETRVEVPQTKSLVP